jgi:hypothetical protein
LRIQAFDYAGEDLPATKLPQTLIATAHAARFATREKNTNDALWHSHGDLSDYSPAAVTFKSESSTGCGLLSAGPILTAQNLNSGILP